MIPEFNSCLVKLDIGESLINSVLRHLIFLSFRAAEKEGELKWVTELNSYSFVQMKRDKPDMLPDLKNVVHEKFNALESRNNDLELQRHEKIVLFKDQLKQMKAQCK